MTDLIDTTEMYLRTIYELEEEGFVPLRARIAERLGHSGPTVSQTVARMERDGLVSVSGDRHLELSAEGRRIATQVMRKHRLAERLLVDVLGLEWELAHDEACRWEHVVSERVERRMMVVLGDRLESPYGNPIPGLAELGGNEPEDFKSSAAPVTEVLESADGARVSGVLRRIGEPAQADLDVLRVFAEVGLRPGALVGVAAGDGGVDLTGPAGTARIAESLAQHVFVEVVE